MQLVTHSLVLCAAPRRRAPSPPPPQKKQPTAAPACRRIVFGAPPRGAQGGEQHARAATALSAGGDNTTGPAGIATKVVGIFDAAEPLAKDSLGAFLLAQLRDGVRAARKARRKALRQARPALRCDGISSPRLMPRPARAGARHGEQAAG